MTKPTFTVVLDQSQDKVNFCSNLLNKSNCKQKCYDQNHVVSDYRKCASLLTSVSKGCTNTKNTDYEHRANHSSAVLFLSINTCKNRANHSSAIRPWSMSEIEDLPNSVKLNCWHYTTISATSILLKFPRTLEAVLLQWMAVPVSLELTVQCGDTPKYARAWPVPIQRT